MYINSNSPSTSLKPMLQESQHQNYTLAKIEGIQNFPVEPLQKNAFRLSAKDYNHLRQTASNISTGLISIGCLANEFYRSDAYTEEFKKNRVNILYSAVTG